MMVKYSENNNVNTSGSENNKAKVLRVIAYFLYINRDSVGEMVSIPCKYLNISRNYKQLINELVYDNIIIVNNSYFAGDDTRNGFTKQYGINPAADMYEVAKIISGGSRNMRREVGQYFHITKHLFHMKVDESDAKQVICSLKPYSQLFSWLSVLDLNSSNIFFSQDKFAGRVYHNLTTMKKEVRAIVKYKGKNLVTMDVTKSHPTQQGILQLNRPKIITSLLPDNVDIVCGDDVEVYLDDIASGAIITKFNTNLSSVNEGIRYHYEKKHGELFDVNNEVVQKRMLLRAFNESITSDLGRILKSLYPTVHATICNIKLGVEKMHRSQIFSRIHQEAERIIIVDKCCLTLSKKFCAIPIHDSITTIEENAEECIKKMENVYWKFMNFTPQIHVEK